MKGIVVRIETHSYYSRYVKQEVGECFSLPHFQNLSLREVVLDFLFFFFIIIILGELTL